MSSYLHRQSILDSCFFSTDYNPILESLNSLKKWLFSENKGDFVDFVLLAAARQQNAVRLASWWMRCLLNLARTCSVNQLMNWMKRQLWSNNLNLMQKIRVWKKKVCMYQQMHIRNKCFIVFDCMNILNLIPSTSRHGLGFFSPSLGFSFRGVYIHLPSFFFATFDYSDYCLPASHQQGILAFDESVETIRGSSVSVCIRVLSLIVMFAWV